MQDSGITQFPEIFFLGMAINFYCAHARMIHGCNHRNMSMVLQLMLLAAFCSTLFLSAIADAANKPNIGQFQCCNVIRGQRNWEISSDCGADPGRDNWDERLGTRLPPCHVYHPFAHFNDGWNVFV